MLRRSLMINPADSVVCVLEDANKGDTVKTPSGEEIILLEDVEFAHKVCIKDLKAGDPVIKYGEEIGYMLAMVAMGLESIFLLFLCFGEGSGCPLAFQVLSAACAVINDMATFDQAGIDDGYLDEIREGDKFTVEASK